MWFEPGRLRLRFSMVTIALLRCFRQEPSAVLFNLNSCVCLFLPSDEPPVTPPESTLPIDSVPFQSPASAASAFPAASSWLSQGRRILPSRHARAASTGTCLRVGSPPSLSLRRRLPTSAVAQEYPPRPQPPEDDLEGLQARHRNPRPRGPCSMALPPPPSPAAVVPGLQARHNRRRPRG
jgi:hypothetical protein